VPRLSIHTLLLTLAAYGAAGHTLRAQETQKTVADGVYTDAQADRGAASYIANCSGCHRPDMGGANGPPLKEERFARDFAGKDLTTLYNKIATTMPRTAPGTLADEVYLDIVAHILKENGFIAGASELTADALGGVNVVAGRAKPAPPVGDFSYVETVGCLTAGPGGAWLLTNAVEPKAVVLPVAANRGSKTPADAAGSQTLRLLDAMAYNPEAHRGHKVYVRGLLIKLPDEQRMTISDFEMIAPGCGGN